MAALNDTGATQQASATFTPENIATSDDPTGLKLAPDGQKVLYINSSYKSGEHDTAAIYIADVFELGSARPLTSGLFDDGSAVFHPDGERIFFTSDRHKASGARQIYSINLSGGEASLVMPSSKDNERGVSSFEISPDGRFIAFLSADEPTAEDKRKDEEKNDAQVFGDQRGFERLRIYSFGTGDVRTLNIQKDRHISSVTWKPDSKEVLFVSLSSNTFEAMCQETWVDRIAIAQGSHSPTRIGTYPLSPSFFSGRIVWTSDDNVLMLRHFNPTELADARALYITTLGKDESVRLYGETECALDVVDIKSEGLVALSIAHGVDTRIEILQGAKKLFTIFDTDWEDIQEFDVCLRPDGTYVFAALTSSSIKRELLNVRVGFAKAGEQAKLTRTLSTHMGWMEDAPALHVEVFKWKGADGVDLEGIATYPSGSNQVTKPLPTILLIRGGPYWRDGPSYYPSSFRWNLLLAARGYLVLSPNYRGSQGHGSAFALKTRADVGTYTQWADCESMLDEALKRKLADSSKLGIGGWSYGGFLAAWGVTQTKNKFKAGIMGASISDWGQMAAENDLPDYVVQLGGSGPWTSGERVDLKRSPIGFVTGVETPMLILHGDKDARVPVSQGISMMRGLRRESKYPERAQLVIYPREGHIVREKAHAIDLMKRVVEHYDTWL